MAKTCQRQGCDKPVKRPERKFCSPGCFHENAKAGTLEAHAEAVASIDLERVTAMAREGNSLDTIAGECGMTRREFLRRRQEHAELEHAFQQGRAGLEDELVGLLLAKARKGQAVPILFALKSMFGYREGEPRRGEAAAQVAVQINLPAPLTPEQYRAQRDAIDVQTVEDADDGS